MAFEVYDIPSKKNKNFFKELSVNSNLIIINLVLFVLFTILLLTKVFAIDAIAIKPANIFQGKYLWTFITSMFMHAGLFHLFVNMFSLFFVGSLVEKLIGSRRFLAFYLASGLFAGLFFVVLGYFFQSDFNTFAVGASGALFGLVGLLMLLTPNQPVYVMFIPIPIKMKYAAPGLLFVLWLISVTGGVPIGNTAHLGGLIAGLVYGIYLRKRFPRKIAMIGKHFS